MCIYNHRLIRGSSLVEVMISLFLLVSALLGFAAMQLNSLQNLTMTRMQARAIQIAADIADALRANPDAVINGNYDGPMERPGGGLDCRRNGCSPGQLALYDKRGWHALISRLPAGEGNILRTSTGSGESLVVQLCWSAELADPEKSCNLDAGAETARSGRYELRLLL